MLHMSLCRGHALLFFRFIMSTIVYLFCVIFGSHVLNWHEYKGKASYNEHFDAGLDLNSWAKTIYIDITNTLFVHFLCFSIRGWYHQASSCVSFWCKNHIVMFVWKFYVFWLTFQIVKQIVWLSFREQKTNTFLF